MGEDGLLRVSRRLNSSDLSYDEKFPTILPKCYLSLLLTRDTHLKLKHAGVNQVVSTLRNQYWIIGLGTLAKRMKRKCFPCQRLDAKACQEPIAPLMEARLKQSPPFSVVGIDYAGPIFCKNAPGQKFYVLLFTCAVIRAEHLELAESLALSHFLLCSS
ncbi:transposon tf2-9 polyprotein [Plakobranchus ocellatus]|uniref:Transposon tf2-9 polyprotein n=1 Tax=Plakobranchus ocellatus TaxID=259542 RepID=A0AAV4DFG7_9GAST|nr:transposon tf2-9 polyprotein [Plakobranchus ocellatus]